ncbi:hypothetical protein MLD38_023894 [Melastoma candidum]|uniref:Uncharacterized protein n=1 Tax=Melastoma candidum TaxID=119954 RepID=A0ACB9NRH8_9MYRT|nr:hypothetical protein MLD38_023894 [Melastoma candidum]
MASNECFANHGSPVLEDGEFWLPPQFLSDDDHHHRYPYPEGSAFPVKFGGAPALAVGFFPPDEFGTGWRASNVSPPGESVLGSTDDSDEEDFIAHLTHKVAQSTLGDGFPPHRSSKRPYSSGSPKSTLCSGCGCGHGSAWGNHGGAPHLKPAVPPTLDLLYQAAGKVANMRLNQQRQQIQRAQYLRLQQQQRLNHLIHLPDPKSEASSYPFQASSQQQLLQFPPPQAPGTGGAKYKKTETTLSSSAWPTLQQARQQLREPVSAGRASGLRPVFLGSNKVLPRGSAGTGVFLPRRVGSPDPEPKRKQGCPTVLIPSRVALALNLNLDEMGSHPPIQPRFEGGARTIRKVTQQQPGVLQRPAAGQEISLPPEWTY